MTIGLDRWKSREIRDGEAQAVVAELRAIGREAAVELADAIDATLAGRTSKHLDVTTWQQRELLARALDHIRNAGRRSSVLAPTGEDRALADLRRNVLRECGFIALVYTLRSPAGAPELFVSQTGTYGEGDRLVTADGRAWRVTDSAPGVGKADAELTLAPE